MRANPKPYEIYRHFKGNLYQIMTLASDSETCDTLVVYQALYSPYKVWVRPLTMFMSEVDHQKYPTVTQTYRFELQTNLPNEKKVIPGGIIPEVSEEQMETGGVSEKRQIEESPTSLEKSKIEDSQEEDYDAEINLDPLVLEFLDSDTYEEKLNILAAIHNRVTDEMINTMAIAMDVEIDEGDLEKRFSELQECVQTLRKYECSRLR